VDRADVVQAADRIRGRVRRTPIHRVDVDDDWLPAGGCLKLELMQHTGTFKARGAFNRILGAAERGEINPSVGDVVASGGNAGLANAYAAAALGVRATVFVPRNSSPTKLHRLTTYGATVVPRGNEYAEAIEAAMEHVASTGAVYCHAYDQPEICAGAGTLGLELLDQLDGLGEQVDTVLVAVGGGGLMSGVAAAVERRAQVVGGEPTLAPTLHAALQAGARLTFRCPASPRTPWAHDVWAPSPGTLHAASVSRACSWTTMPSARLGTSCGTATGWPWRRAQPPRWPR
jgi:threonine dehydratase